MSVFRFDATTRDWVVYAPERAARPKESMATVLPSVETAPCPFCPENETLSPGDLLRLPEAVGPWAVRVIPNKFPLLRPSEDQAQRRTGLFEEKAGIGSHEVLIESPEHAGYLGGFPLNQVEAILGAILRRYRALREQPGVRAILVFKNHGEAAGTSLRHPHWQIVAAPVVPRKHRNLHSIAQEYFDRTDRCLYCDLLDAELREGVRIIAANEGFVAVAPFASEAAYQIRIIPKRHSPSFAGLTDRELPLLAALLRDILSRLRAALGDPPFNLTLSSAPIGDENKAYFLWHFDISPRLSTPAGFEMGSGMPVNLVLPETAAAKLRAIPGQDASAETA